jgi:hypothetical protein
MRASVGPTAENLHYGDAVSPRTRNVNPQQFHTLPVEVVKPTDDGGYLGPLGDYGTPTPAGSLYGYGVSGTDTGVSSGIAR